MGMGGLREIDLAKSDTHYFIGHARQHAIIAMTLTRAAAVARLRHTLHYEKNKSWHRYSILGYGICGEHAADKPAIPVNALSFQVYLFVNKPK